MNRRQIIQSLGLISSHVLFPGILSTFFSSCQGEDVRESEDTLLFFSKTEANLIKEVVDIILPATKTKSASEVGTHLFLDEVFAKCLNPEQLALIREGIIALESSYAAASDKYTLLAEIDQKAFSGSEDEAYFQVIKQYALVGFFTSLEGMTKASQYVKFPGDYNGAVTLTPATLNQAKTNLRYYL